MSDVANVSVNAAVEEGEFTEDVFDLMAKIENDGAIPTTESADAETNTPETAKAEDNAAECGEAADSSESATSDTAEAGSNVIPFSTTAEEAKAKEPEAEAKTEEKEEKPEEKIELVLPKDEDFLDPGTGDNLKDATAKLQKELDKVKSVPEGMPAMVLSWLLKQLPGDPVLCERVMWKHKTYDGCAAYMYQKAAEICYKQMKEMSVAKMRDGAQTITVDGVSVPTVGFSMANDISYCHAIEYFRLDDLAKVKEEAIKKAKAEYESKKTSAKIKAAAKSTTAKSNAKSSKSTKPAAKADKTAESKEEKTEDLMSLFDMDM